LQYLCEDASCEDTFVLNSHCYKVHKNEKVSFFTAVNSCLSNNASLAVFDDDVRDHFPSTLLSDKAWIGLMKSWWTWPDSGKFQQVLNWELWCLLLIWAFCSSLIHVSCLLNSHPGLLSLAIPPWVGAMITSDGLARPSASSAQTCPVTRTVDILA